MRAPAGAVAPAPPYTPVTLPKRRAAVVTPRAKRCYAAYFLFTRLLQCRRAWVTLDQRDSSLALWLKCGRGRPNL